MQQAPRDTGGGAAGAAVEGRAPDDLGKSVVTRLRRIEGQVQGLQRMLEGGRECEELLTQIMAVRSSIDQVGILLMEHHLERCILDELPADSPLAKELNLALRTWARFGLVPGARSDLPAIDDGT